MKFLLADDNREDCMLIRQTLLAEFGGARCVVVSGQDEFAQELSKGCEAIITEFRPGWTDGMALLRQVRQHDAVLPAIMLSNHANVQLAVAALKAGFSDFLLKEQLSRLPIVLRACLERAKTQREAGQQQQQAEVALQRLSAIQTITDAALGTLALDQLLRELLQRISHVLSCETATVLLLAEDERHLVVRASFGLEEDGQARIRIPLGQGVVGRIAAQNEPLIFNDLKETSAASGLTGLLGQKTSSMLGAPLRARGKVIGVVHVGTQTRRSFTQEDLSLLQVVADRAATAIDRAQLYEQVLAGRDRLRYLSKQLIEAQETERRRLARELHDETGQALTAVKLNLQALKQRSGDLLLAAQLEDSIGIVEHSLQQLRDLSHELRPSLLDDLGLVAALRWFVDRQARRGGLSAHFTAPENFARLAAEVETACFRIVQEALTNIIKHASAQRVWVELDTTPSEVLLLLRDDGIGFNVQAARENALLGGSLGLLGMQERAQLAGGKFEIKSGKIGGTEICVRFAKGAAWHQSKS